MDGEQLGDQIKTAMGCRIALSRHEASDPADGTRREWLTTTGAGDYAMGTTSLIASRRYHGMLIGATRAPIARRMLVSFIDEEIAVGDTRTNLGSRRWNDGSIDPDGYRSISGFALDGGIPTWTFELGAARIEKRVVMLRDVRAVAVIWTVVESALPVTLDARIFVEHRGHHQLDPDATWLPETTADTSARATARIVLPANPFAADATTLYVAAPGAAFAPAANWWRRHQLAEERARGYDSAGSSCHALTAIFVLTPGETRALVVGLDRGLAEMPVDGIAIVERERVRERALLAKAGMLDAVPELQTLCLAADTFVVTRPRKDGSVGRSIIAGFPWFEDWGRDAMIALPGLLLQTGRADEAKLVIETFLEHLADGLLPNRFPDESTVPEYHSADAPLLAIAAAIDTWRASRDDAWLDRVLPALLSIVESFMRGTRHGIMVDTDGLVRAGEEGLQLTWMDAKIGDHVVTPRMGKPIELSALWLDALLSLREVLRARDRADERATLMRIEQLAATTHTAFSRYWNPDTQCFRDLLDGPAGDDNAIRPNQLFALASIHRPFDADWCARARGVLAARLSTPLAVRTLAAGTSGYRGRYEGDQRSRDLAYHNGTAWPFLAGLRLRAETLADPARGARLANLILSDLAGQFHDAGLGSIGEVADGDPPHESRGCPMQAWSVGCLLDALSTSLQRGFRS
jgi:glycogen debranching enzyme